MARRHISPSVDAPALMVALEDLSRRCHEVRGLGKEPRFALMPAGRFAELARALGNLVIYVEHDTYGRGLSVMVPMGDLQPSIQIQAFPVRGLKPGVAVAVVGA